MPLLLLPQGNPGATPPAIPVLPHRRVSARLLDKAGAVIGGDPLATAFDVQWYDEWNGPGHGQVSMPLSEAGALQLIPGRYVDCLVEDAAGVPQPRFTFKIEGNPSYRQIQRGEEFQQVVTVQGRGWTCIYDEAVTFPEFNLNFTLDTTWRLFSFASALFPNAGGWLPAVEQAEYLDGVAEWDCYQHAQTAPDGLVYPAPIGWPWGTNPHNLVDGVPTANYRNQYWIVTADQPNYVSAGYYFFRLEVTIGGSGFVTFDVTGDNYFTFFLEGVPILGEQINKADHGMWAGWKTKTLFLPAGTYTFAGVVYNIAFSDLGGGPVVQAPCPAHGFAGGARDENPGGMLFASYTPGDIFTAPTAIAMSDNSWDSHYEEEFWPGWYPSQIIDQLISEAITNGAIAVHNGVTYTDLNDSNGMQWRPADADYDRPDIPTFAVEVGTTLMAALQQMHEIGWINWHGQPGTFLLDVFRGRLPTPASSGSLEYGVNIATLERNATTPYANALLVQWAGGYVAVTDPAAIASFGTAVWDVFSTDAATIEDATILGQNQLAIRAQDGFPSVVVTVEPQTTLDVPYEGYEHGSYLSVPDTSGGTELLRVLSIACQQDELGYAEWTLEMNAKLDVPERRVAQLLQQIGGRNMVVRGRVTP